MWPVECYDASDPVPVYTPLVPLPAVVFRAMDRGYRAPLAVSRADDPLGAALQFWLDGIGREITACE